MTIKVLQTYRLWRVKNFSDGYLDVASELDVVEREAEGLWKEVVLLGELILHRLHVLGKEVLPRDVDHSWKMVDPLLRGHPP